jgi:hypothetical protein
VGLAVLHVLDGAVGTRGAVGVAAAGGLDGGRVDGDHRVAGPRGEDPALGVGHERRRLELPTVHGRLQAVDPRVGDVEHGGVVRRREALGAGTGGEGLAHGCPLLGEDLKGDLVGDVPERHAVGARERHRHPCRVPGGDQVLGVEDRQQDEVVRRRGPLVIAGSAPAGDQEPGTPCRGEERPSSEWHRPNLSSG